MRAMSWIFHKVTRDWQLAVALGFAALTASATVADHRNANTDRSVVEPHSIGLAVVPPTNRELVREMMTHD